MKRVILSWPIKIIGVIPFVLTGITAMWAWIRGEPIVVDATLLIIAGIVFFIGCIIGERGYKSMGRRT